MGAMALDSYSDELSVETRLGKVVGKRDGKHAVAYLGIPFAEPPLGKLRFRPPVPKRPWAPRVHYAMNYSSECLQSNLYSSDKGTPRQRSEDCLFLNIWRPAKSKSNNSPAPVLFWVYGGAFIQGAASKPEYIGSRLAARGVIVVSVNYRLGALGFLVSTADGLFGNYGLADQKLAMQWTHDNIAAFGGDPGRVTLFGESAGAMSIGLHFLDQERRQRAPQLFQGLILQSNPLGYKYRNIVVANFLGTDYKELLDCEDLRCLQSESADELIHVQDTLMAVPRSIGDFFTWGPVVTDHHYQREVRLRPGPVADIEVLPPILVLQELRRVDIPVLMGTNSHEGTVFVYTAFPHRMPKPVYLTLILSFFRTTAPRVC
jgi:carboxylesterase type B